MVWNIFLLSGSLMLHADLLQLHWVKYGGAIYRLGLLPPTLIR